MAKSATHANILSSLKKVMILTKCLKYEQLLTNIYNKLLANNLKETTIITC